MSTEPRPWEVIRAAADRIADCATRTTPPPWVDEKSDGFITSSWAEEGTAMWRSIADVGFSADRDWIIALSPAVAEPLVAWLEGSARAFEQWDSYRRRHGMESDADGVSDVESAALDFARQLRGERP